MGYELAKKLRGVDGFTAPGKRLAVNLDDNESCFNIGEIMGAEIAEAVKKVQLNRYPDPAAEEVTEVFADYYGIDPRRCTAGNGSDELIWLILGNFLEKGDTVLTLSPDFSMYAFYGFLSELKVNALPKESDMKINVSKVIEYCNNNSVGAVIFSNPCNPTSLGVNRQDMIRLVKNVFSLVIVDEAYMDFWGESIMDCVEEYDNLIVLKTCSKNMGLAGLRLGFAVSSDRITRAIKGVKSPYNVSSLSQAAACAVLRNKGLLSEYTAEIIESRKKLREEICTLSERFFAIERVYDSVTNFVFMRAAHSGAICEGLRKRSVAVRELGNYIRVTAGTPEENEIFLNAFRDVLSEM